jgi:CheY-like chemotaxis protein
MKVSQKKSPASVMIILSDHDRRVEFRKMVEEQFSMTVFSVADPIQGLALLQKIPAPDFLLLSSGDLPIMNYMEFLKQKANSSKIAGIPVILLSATLSARLPSDVVEEVVGPLGRDEFASLVKRYCSPE